MKYLGLFTATALLAACTSAETTSEDTEEASEERQQETVETAIRNAYQNQGAEVTDINMERSADGYRYVGNATVRNTENGNEIMVDCTVEANRTGEPEIECNRVQDTEGDDTAS